MPVQYLATGHSAGEECSSTYEGRHLTLEESYLTHPTHDDVFVDKGDPVVVGRIVGVAFNSAAAATDLIAIDTEGIWFLSAVAVNDAGNSAIAPGDEIFINRTTAVLSKITNIATQQPFGYALGDVPTGTTAVVAIKVHHDPTVDAALAMFGTVISGGYGKSMRATLAGGASEGICDYLEGHLSAAQTGLLYGRGSWINIDSAELLNGSIITPDDVGIWAGTDQTLGRVVFAGQAMAILNNAPASLHAWRLNTTQVITALIAAANPGSVGYVAGAGVASAKVGAVPLFDIVGPGIVWVRLYDSAV